MRLASGEYGTGTWYPFDELGVFDDYSVVKEPHNLSKEDCLVIWGGADISPSLYNKAVSQRTHADRHPSWRDESEWALMQKAMELGIPIIGICRGAQMLCAAAGGTLIQDVNNHGSSHPVDTSTGKKLKVSSVHHQMMNPWAVDHELIAWSAPAISDWYLDVDTPIEVPCEPEYVYFPKIRGHAIQWHPEFMQANAAATQFIVDMFNTKER